MSMFSFYQQTARNISNTGVHATKALAAAAFMLIASLAYGTELLGVVDGPATNRNDYTGTIGNWFIVGPHVPSIRVTKLGFEDAGMDGLTTTHEVGIWDINAVKLAEVTVQSGTASALGDEHWRYESLASPLVLTNGWYSIGAKVVNGDGDAWTDTGAAPAPADFSADSAAVNRAAYKSGDTFGRPNQTNLYPYLRWGAANMEFTIEEREFLFGVTNTNGPSGNRSDWSGMIGSDFTVGANALSVTALGFEDTGLDGLSSTHQVRIWETSSQTELALVNIQSGEGSTRFGNWRYETLATPLTLEANTTYTIGAEVYNGGDAWTDTGTDPVDFSIHANATILDAASGNQDAFPSGTANPDLRWAGANMMFTAIIPPEGTLIVIE